MREEIIRRRLRFLGAVQGVGFRWRACHAADGVGATGWVRNEPDGSVTMEIQGTEAQIDRVILQIAAGRWVDIARMEAKTIPLRDDERGFHAADDLW